MPYNRRNREVRRFVHRRRMEVRCSDVRRTMSESPHTVPKPRVDAASAGGDDRKGARRGAIFIGFVLIAYLVYLVVTGQFAEFVEAMSTVQGSWIVVASICMVFYIIFGVVAYAIAVWLDPESPVGIRDLISVEAAGTFFGNLTPMMVGGTPAQIYRLTKAAGGRGRRDAVHALYRIPSESGALGCDFARGALAVLHLALRRHDASVPLQLRRPCGAARRALRDLALPALRDPRRALGHRSCRARGRRERPHARVAHLCGYRDLLVLRALQTCRGASFVHGRHLGRHHGAARLPVHGAVFRAARIRQP